MVEQLPTPGQVFNRVLGPSRKDTIEKARSCKILCDGQVVGFGVLACVQCGNDDTESDKHCIITSHEVLKNGNLADGDYKVQFLKDSKVTTFDLKDVRKLVGNVASGLMVIFMNSSLPEFKHKTKKCRKLPLTIANFDKHQQAFCYVENQCYNIESNGMNGKYFLKAADKNCSTSAQSTIQEGMLDGTVILQEVGGNEKAVGIFNVVDKTQMEISPFWLEPGITDKLGELNI